MGRLVKTLYVYMYVYMLDRILEGGDTINTNLILY
jgi:hypothetical protein